MNTPDITALVVPEIDKLLAEFPYPTERDPSPEDVRRYRADIAYIVGLLARDELDLPPERQSVARFLHRVHQHGVLLGEERAARE